MTSTSQLLTVAVLNRIDNRLAVWHVDVGPGLGLARLSGAWVLDIGQTTEIGILTDGHYAVDCSAEPRLPEGIATAGRLDIDAMAAAVRFEIDSADALFTEYVAGLPKSKHPVRPDWPTVVYPANTSALTQRADEVVRPALAAAHSLKDLAANWFEFEGQRVARSFLVDHGGPEVRPFPLVFR